MIHRLIGFYRIPPGGQENKGCDILVYLTFKKSVYLFAAILQGGCIRDRVPDVVAWRRGSRYS
jgi:hypothetical protein